MTVELRIFLLFSKSNKMFYLLSLFYGFSINKYMSRIAMRYCFHLIFFVIFCHHSFLFSQNQFGGGFYGGVSTSQVGGDGYSGFDKAGVAVGGFVNTSFTNKKLDWQFEILYLNKGSRQAPDFEKGIPYLEIKLSYVEVPLLIRYHYKKLLFELGVSYGRLVSHREFDGNGDIANPRPFKLYEVAGLVGLNYAFTEKLMMNVRISNSILPVRDFFIVSRFGPAGGSYNNILMFTLRYEFSKKSKE